MLSGKLGRFIVAIVVMLILMGLTAEYALDDNEKAGWRKLSAQGMNLKIQTGLTQIYWQWQQQGRTKQIVYQPQNEKQGFVINISSKGFPEVQKNTEGCKQFLTWFIDKKVLSNQVEVSTTFIERKETNKSLQNAANKKAEANDICRFSYANKILQYDLITGQFTFTD